MSESLSAPIRLPETTLRGRPLQPVAPVPLAGEPDAPGTAGVARGDDLIVQRSHVLTRHSGESGELLAVWPLGAIGNEAAKALGPCAFSGARPLAVEPSSGDLLWLFDESLEEYARLSPAAIAHPALEAAPFAIEDVRAARGTDALLLLHDPRHERYCAALVSEHGETKALVALAAGRPRDLAVLGQGMLLAYESELVYQPFSEAAPQSVLPLEPIGRLWPSPDARYVVATGDARVRFSLFTLAKGEPRIVYEGMYRGGEQSPHGWVFWDLQDPLLENGTPLDRPRVAWSPDSRFAVIGDAGGRAAIVDAVERRAVKLMTPPEQPFWPLGLRAPSQIRYADAQGFAWLELDWAFGEPPAKSEAKTADIPVATGESPAPSEAQAKTHADSAPSRWLVPALVAAGLALAALGLWWRLG